ncbi:protein of unknown function [Candidatus Promineifilum breve]|uniref:Serine protease n=1 Tax=Candidatus Promineifilum breve TaxID=1806508 RepID=A0A160T2V7_9CHLR|nr:trypsin-like peptidase domain-containing protein [Candidatus Promineifilum breve]CUS03248.2 protein of unknown function [Candidatus Promineifilum breve]
MPSKSLTVELRNLFIDRFSDDELADLAFALGMNIKDLGEDTTKGKARELAAYVVRHEWVAKLIAEVGPKERPEIEWQALLTEHVSRELLSDDDRSRLVDILANNYDMQMGPSARYGLMDRAGLRERLKFIDLAGAPLSLAYSIVSDLEPLGILPGQPSFHALGALINYILQLPDTTTDDARILAELLVKYQLISDPAYLDGLTTTYSIDVTPVRHIDPSLLPPPVTAKDLARLSTEAPAVIKDESPVSKVLIRSSEDNLLDIDLLAGAIYSAQAVGRIELPRGRAHGTGFLVGPDLLLTAYHVLKSKDMLESAVIRFDYQANADGVVTQGRVFELMPDFYVGSPDTELDFALVRVKGEPLAERRMRSEDEGQNYLELLRRGRHRGYLLVSPSKIVEFERINIIQHPNGGPQKAMMTENYVLNDMKGNRVHYLAITQPGSAGSPVLNRRWEVVALHHSGGAHPPLKDSADTQKLEMYRFGEGIPMRAILPKIEKWLPRS